MLQFFQTIVDSITTIFNVLLSFIQGIVSLLAMIPNILTFTSSMTLFVPTFLVAFFTANIAIAIVLTIIGRK